MIEIIPAMYIVCTALFLFFVAIGLVLCSGRGSFLISGYNTMPKAKRDQYDKKALSRAVGTVVLIMAAAPAAAIIGLVMESWSVLAAAGVYLFIAVVASLIYLNTGGKFKK